MLNASKLQSSWCCHSNWRPNQYSNAFFFSDLMLQSLPEESSEQRDCVKSFLTSTLSCSGLWGMKSEPAESEFWPGHVGPAKPLCSQKKPALCFFTPAWWRGSLLCCFSAGSFVCLTYRTAHLHLFVPAVEVSVHRHGVGSVSECARTHKHTWPSICRWCRC